jgi:N-acylneuraminate cytidylyltransferase
MRLAIIPARGGSKRIPGKNIKPFCGKPMIAWSIEAALQSGCFDEVIVSTDDIGIAEVARAFGAQVPFQRPDSLSDDHTGTIPVIQHAIQWYQQSNLPVRQVCCIYATAPFLQARDLQEGQLKMEMDEIDYVFAATSFPFPIQRAFRLGGRGRIGMFHPEHFNTRSQDLEDAYHDAGQFYWGRPEAWLAGKVIFGESSSTVLLPRHRVQDIDTAEDWQRAEWMFKAMRTEADAPR